MSVTLRPYRSGGWEVDIAIRLPDGSQYRERKRASRFSKSAAHRWAEDRERYLLQHGPPTTSKEVPTLEAFAPRFVDGHARANRHKPSGVASIESILKWHLVPMLGPRRLDAITNEQVQRLKLALSHRAPKTVNNVLTVLSTLLKKAIEWGELERLPCAIKLLTNAALHAPESGGDGRRDPVARRTTIRPRTCPNVWRHSGHARGGGRKYLSGKDLVERATGIEPV